MRRNYLHSDCAQVDEVNRERRSLRGWRWCLDYSRELIGELATLKGATAYRGKIDTARHELQQALNSSDMEVLRNTTLTADMAIALAEADKLLPGKAWLMGRGMGAAGAGAFGFAVYATADDVAPLAMAERDSPRDCVAAVVAQLKAAYPALEVAS
jgi:hypothetical protein